MPDQVLHFGKHKGKPLADIPLQYLEWLILNVKDRSSVTAAISELDRRGNALPTGAKRPMVEHWEKAMSRTHYLWQGWHGNQEWIPNSVDMTGREHEECPFEVEPWDTQEA